ncbi:MAG: hypothetical protein ACLFTK_09555 [Anaerolineales bacterium]
MFTDSQWIARRASLFVIGAALLVGIFVWRATTQHAMGFPLDDSWIHQTYARNLAQSGEWAFVPGEASTASTAPLYTVLLAIGHALGLAPFLWAHVLGTLALGLGAELAARIAEHAFPNQRAVGWGTGLTVLFTWQLIWAAASGMETMLYMTLALAVVWRTIKSPTPDGLQGGWLVGIFGGLLYLTRPEGVGLVGLAGLLMLVTHWGKGYFRWAVAVALSFGVVVAPYVIWNYAQSGELLPSTASAKVAQFAPQRDAFSLPQHYTRLLIPPFIGAQLLLLPGMVVGIRQLIQARQYVYLLPLVYAVAHLSLYALRLPASFQHGRYVMPIIPMLLLYGVGGWLHILHIARFSAVGRVVTRSLALSTVGVLLAFIWIGAGAYANDVRIINTEMVETARWVEDNIPLNDLFAVHDIGALGYYAPRDVLDLAGLVSPEVVPIINNDAALMQLICARNAQWLMVFPDQRPAPRDDPRLQVVYESPYEFANEARGAASETWKMRVYAIQCTP